MINTLAACNSHARTSFMPPQQASGVASLSRFLAAARSLGTVTRRPEFPTRRRPFSWLSLILAPWRNLSLTLPNQENYSSTRLTLPFSIPPLSSPLEGRWPISASTLLQPFPSKISTSHTYDLPLAILFVFHAHTHTHTHDPNSRSLTQYYIRAALFDRCA